jgi:hypothetical protein
LFLAISFLSFHHFALFNEPYFADSVSEEWPQKSTRLQANDNFSEKNSKRRPRRQPL